MFRNERSNAINMIALFNKYFSTPSIDECVLELSLDDFMNFSRVLAIKNSEHKIDFSFEPLSISRVAECLANLNTMKSDGPDGLSPKLLKLSAPLFPGLLQSYLITVSPHVCGLVNGNFLI